MTIRWEKIRWGTLTAWLARHEKAIRRRYGVSPFTKTGEINDRVLRMLLRDEEFLRKLAGPHWKRVKRKILFKLNVLGD